MATSGSKEQFDFIIVGAGSAGSVLAKRLTEDSRYKVCVLEAGPVDRDLHIHVPAGYIKTLFKEKLTWAFDSEPVPEAANRSIKIRVGKVLGGSSSINGMIYHRGQPGDYDHWAQCGNPGWSYSDVLPFFRKSEARTGAADEGYHGTQGPLTVTDPAWNHPLCQKFIEAAQELGFPEVPDFNGKHPEGVGPFHFTVDRSGLQPRRMSTARAFLHPATKTGRVDVRPKSYVTGIIFEGKRAVGVRYSMGSPSGPTREVYANAEVILSAGALNTPRLLQISGLGEPDHIASLGVKPLVNLPGVGNNLMDHFVVRSSARIKDIRTINEAGQGLPVLWEIAKWMTGNNSILSLGPVPMRLFVRSHPDLDAPNYHLTFIPASYNETRPNSLLDEYPGMTCGGFKQRPESRGYIRATSTDLNAAPVIQPNYMGAESDRRDTIAIIKLTRKLMETNSFKNFYVSETVPGKDVRSDDEILDFARRLGNTTYHWSGSAKMGPETDPMAVVDARLRVRGVSGLRVVDASIMPAITSGNTNAPTIMIAERAADLILQDQVA